MLGRLKHQQTGTTQLQAETASDILAILYQSLCHATESRRDIWEFSVDLCDFRSASVSKQELRWLLSRGLIAHAKEISRCEESGRKFISIRSLSIPEGSCFVLTKQGLKHLLAEGNVTNNHQNNGADLRLPRPSSNNAKPKGRWPQLALPHWNAELKELRLAGELVKRFHRPARNQETILAEFQRLDWKQRIADPLPVEEERLEQTAPRRLQDAIRSLNRHQVRHLLQFRGDGSGSGVVWEPK